MIESSFLATLFRVNKSSIVLSVYITKLRPRKSADCCVSIFVQCVDRMCRVHAAFGGNLINLSEDQHSSANLLNEELCCYVRLLWQGMSVVSVLIRLSLFRQIRHGTVPKS